MTPASTAVLLGISVCAQVLQNENRVRVGTQWRGTNQDIIGVVPCSDSQGYPRKNKISLLQYCRRDLGKKYQKTAKEFPIFFFRTPREKNAKEIPNHQQKSRRGKVGPWGYQPVLPLDHREKHK